MYHDITSELLELDRKKSREQIDQCDLNLPGHVAVISMRRYTLTRTVSFSTWAWRPCIPTQNRLG